MEKVRAKVKKIKTRRKHGFLKRMSSHNGRKLLKRRMNKRREKLSA